MPVYDSDSMAIAAGQVEKLKDEFEKSKHKVTGLDHEKESPFGGMDEKGGGVKKTRLLAFGLWLLVRAAIGIVPGKPAADER